MRKKQRVKREFFSLFGLLDEGQRRFETFSGLRATGLTKKG
jgi:hypothetical protein